MHVLVYVCTSHSLPWHAQHAGAVADLGSLTTTVGAVVPCPYTGWVRIARNQPLACRFSSNFSRSLNVLSALEFGF